MLGIEQAAGSGEPGDRRFCGTRVAVYAGLSAVAYNGWLGVNMSFTFCLTSTTIVNTPSTVPNGMKQHSIAAMTRQNV